MNDHAHRCPHCASTAVVPLPPTPLAMCLACAGTWRPGGRGSGRSRARARARRLTEAGAP